jgi:hypothetical protein
MPCRRMCLHRAAGHSGVCARRACARGRGGGGGLAGCVAACTWLHAWDVSSPCRRASQRALAAPWPPAAAHLGRQRVGPVVLPEDGRRVVELRAVKQQRGVCERKAVCVEIHDLRLWWQHARTHTHAHMHTYTHTCTHMHTCTHTRGDTGGQGAARVVGRGRGAGSVGSGTNTRCVARGRAHVCLMESAHTRTAHSAWRMLAHTHTHTRAHAHTHTHTHTPRESGTAAAQRP